MNNKNIILTVAAILFMLTSASARCDSGLSYESTVELIRDTMASSTSDERKESYGAISFNKCILDYTVSGTYPVGTLYTIRFSNLDFSSLNYRASKAGHDYTAFIILNFNKGVHVREDFKERTIRSVVVNVSSDEQAERLYKAFLHLGELCGAPERP